MESSRNIREISLKYGTSALHIESDNVSLLNFTTAPRNSFDCANRNVAHKGGFPDPVGARQYR